jgi:WD40 repeat protein
LLVGSVAARQVLAPANQPPEGAEAPIAAPNGKSILTCGATAAGIVIWDPIEGQTIRTLLAYGVRDFVLSPDGKTAAALDSGKPYEVNGNVLHVWDLASGAPHTATAAEQGHLGEVDALAFAPDGRTIASSCRLDHTVRIWETSRRP